MLELESTYLGLSDRPQQSLVGVDVCGLVKDTQPIRGALLSPNACWDMLQSHVKPEQEKGGGGYED